MEGDRPPVVGEAAGKRDRRRACCVEGHGELADEVQAFGDLGAHFRPCRGTEPKHRYDEDVDFGEHLDDGEPAFLVRRPADQHPDTSLCRRHCQVLELSQIDLSYAGRLPEGHPELAAIQGLHTGSVVKLRKRGDLSGNL